MKLTLSATKPSPVNLPYCTTWVAQQAGKFVISDMYKIVAIAPDGYAEIIWEASDENAAYAVKGYCDERLPDDFYQQISERALGGFCLLEKAEYKCIDQPNGSSSLMELVKTYGPFDRALPVRAHDRIVSFGKKSISLHALNGNTLGVLSKINTKGKTPINAALHPVQNLIVYGTNAGELYGQHFDDNGFGKAIKIDQLPNTCYQLEFNAGGNRLFVCGMGYLRVFEFDGSAFVQIASLATASRSFALSDHHLFLNKGIHGIDVLHVAGEPRRATSLDVPFSIDKMEYLPSPQTLFITSGFTQEIALVACDEA